MKCLMTNSITVKGLHLVSLAEDLDRGVRTVDLVQVADLDQVVLSALVDLADLVVLL
jgi:hypothetical protein